MTWKTSPCQRAETCHTALQNQRVWVKPSLQLHSGSAHNLIAASTSYSKPTQLLIQGRIIHRGPAEGLDSPGPSLW